MFFINIFRLLAEDNMLGDQSYRYLTADEMKSLGDDSLPFDVTKDERASDSNRDLLGMSFDSLFIIRIDF
jgi:ankyrin